MTEEIRQSIKTTQSERDRAFEEIVKFARESIKETPESQKLLARAKNEWNKNNIPFYSTRDMFHAYIYSRVLNNSPRSL